MQDREVVSQVTVATSYHIHKSVSHKFHHHISVTEISPLRSLWRTFCCRKTSRLLVCKGDCKIVNLGLQRQAMVLQQNELAFVASHTTVNVRKSTQLHQKYFKTNPITHNTAAARAMRVQWYKQSLVLYDNSRRYFFYSSSCFLSPSPQRSEK